VTCAYCKAVYERIDDMPKQTKDIPSKKPQILEEEFETEEQKRQKAIKSFIDNQEKDAMTFVTHKHEHDGTTKTATIQKGKPKAKNNREGRGVSVQEIYVGTEESKISRCGSWRHNFSCRFREAFPYIVMGSLLTVTILSLIFLR